MRFISCHDGKLEVLGTQAFRAPAARAFTTGLDALDALAPGGGFARGAVHEILSAPEHGTPLFFAALLAAASGQGDEAEGRKFILWCDPTKEIYPPALANHGIALTHLFLVRPREPRDLLWSISEALRCKGVAAVVAAPPRLSRVAARRLQLSAERGGGVGLLLRRANSPDIGCYAAATRWLVRPAPGQRTVQRWSVQLIHGHGGCVGQTVFLELSRENHSVRALESLAHRPVETRPTTHPTMHPSQTPTIAQAS
jgi:protein ImuA